MIRFKKEFFKFFFNDNSVYLLNLASSAYDGGNKTFRSSIVNSLSFNKTLLFYALPSH